MRHDLLLRRIRNRTFHNVAFRDMLRMMEKLGFELSRVAGSHHIFVHPRLAEVVSLQEVRGEAKPYQIRQVLRLIDEHNLDVEDES
jgi:predicted RNA binding protein YcfA (HicA-like mRNA interferase family)